MFIFTIKCFELTLGMPLYLSKLTFPKLYTFKADFRPADQNNFSTLDIKVLEIYIFYWLSLFSFGHLELLENTSWEPDLWISVFTVMVNE